MSGICEMPRVSGSTAFICVLGCGCLGTASAITTLVIAILGVTGNIDAITMGSLALTCTVTSSIIQQFLKAEADPELLPPLLQSRWFKAISLIVAITTHILLIVGVMPPDIHGWITIGTFSAACLAAYTVFCCLPCCLACCIRAST